MNDGNQEARRRVLREEAIAITVAWDLPDLDGDSDAEIELSLIARAEALRLIHRELIEDHGSGERRAAPFGPGPALQWWELVALPAARGHTGGAWWIHRTPQGAMEWAIALDPIGSSEH